MPEATQKLLAAVWEKNLPVVRERVEELASAITLAQAGVLDVLGREAAIATAHKLAGSLGMFGYSEGTDAARALEHGFESTPLNAAHLSDQVVKLRNALSL